MNIEPTGSGTVRVSIGEATYELKEAGGCLAITPGGIDCTLAVAMGAPLEKSIKVEQADTRKLVRATGVVFVGLQVRKEEAP